MYYWLGKSSQTKIEQIERLLVREKGFFSTLFVLENLVELGFLLAYRSRCMPYNKILNINASAKNISLLFHFHPDTLLSKLYTSSFVEGKNVMTICGIRIC